MLPAPSLDAVRGIVANTRTEIIGILFAPPYTDIGSEKIVPRLAYLDERTAQYIHFFCAGFGGYTFADDAEPIADITYENGTMIPWGFSQRMFAAFVTELEQVTSWRYSGEADLILTRPTLDFRECIVYDLNAMLAEGVGDSASRLFEAIIQYSRKHRKNESVAQFSDRQGCAVLGDVAGDAILELLPGPLRQLWKRGRHFRTRNLSPR